MQSSDLSLDEKETVSQFNVEENHRLAVNVEANLIKFTMSLEEYNNIIKNMGKKGRTSLDDREAIDFNTFR